MSVIPNIRLAPPPDDRPPTPDGMDVTIENDGNVPIITDPASGAIAIPTDDGGVVIDFNPGANRDQAGAKAHDANLAEYLDDGELGRIANDLLTGIASDEQSRAEWMETRAQGIRLLGLNLSPPRSDAMSAASASEGMSTIQHPLMLEATLRFQANARGELLPSGGPVKVRSDLDSDGILKDGLAEALEKDMNYWVRVICTEYTPDTDRMLFSVGFGGCGFKKVFNDPIRRRPRIESVDAKDLIVSDAMTDLANAGRVTHRIDMRPSTLKRMQLCGSYRDVDLPQTGYQTPDVVRREIAEMQGMRAVPQLPQDQDYLIYECYCELDIAGFEHKAKGKKTGLALPYKVTLEKDSMAVLEIRRNWIEDDPMQLARQRFVKYPFVPGLGFYDIGFIHILGNTTNAVTAAWREMLDAGMFANFPGFLYAKMAGRQLTNEFRVPPGGGVPIETMGQPIGNAVMPLPYKDISPAFAGFVGQIEETGQRVGGTAEIQVGEGNTEAPVGTTLALIEQAQKILDAVHKRLHAAQAEEFQMLKECFRDDPESFIRAVRGKGSRTAWDETKFLAALEAADIVPQADPNTPSHMHRLMKVMAVKQLQAANPGLYDIRAVDTWALNQIGVADAQTLFAPDGQQPAPDPKILAKAAEIQSRTQQAAQQNQANLIGTQLKGAIAERASNDKVLDRASKEKIAAMDITRELIIHATSPGIMGNKIQSPEQPPLQQGVMPPITATKVAEPPAMATLAPEPPTP